MHLADAIERDADVGDVRGFQSCGLFRGDERAIGGDGKLQSRIGGQIDEVEKARMNQGFSTGEEQRGELILGEVTDHGAHLVPVELAGILGGHRVGVAVDAAEVAGAGDVPHDDRFAASCAGCGGMAVSIAESVGRLFVSGPEAGEVDHGEFLLESGGEKRGGLIGAGAVLGEGITGESVGAGA